MMKFSFYIRFSIISLILIAVVSCQEVLDILPANSSEEIISATINDQVFEVEGGKSILDSEFVIAEMVEDQDHFLLTVYGVQVADTKEVTAMGFKLGGKSLAELEIGKEYTSWQLLKNSEVNFEGVMGAVEKRTSPNSDDHIYKASSNHTGEISFIIHELDIENKSISGVFNYKAKDKDKGTVLEVNNGKFEKIEWVDL
ncbi:hypothetical protein JYB64_07210 [Algoriphagus aestuarii]|nr:hypothetical protein [Algoriphagus aestuarii]